VNAPYTESESTVTTQSPVRLVLVDDCDLAVAGINSLLAPYADRVELIDNRHALAHPEDLDVILYEPVGQSSMSQALLKDLQRGSEARAAVFSWAPAGQLASANRHLVKTLTASQLVVAVEELAEGRHDEFEVPDSDDVIASVAPVATLPQEEVDPVLASLTPRETDIVARIVAGRSNREIGEELVLSVNSVKTYIRSAYRKMGVERRTQAVLWGLEHGFGESNAVAAVPSLVG